MTKEEIKKGLEKCTGVSCNGCPYNDNYTTCTDRLKLDARELIIKQEKEIAWLYEVIKNYKEVLCETTQRKDDAIKLNDKLIDEYEIKVKQAKIDVLNELKTKAFDIDDCNGWAGSTFVVLVRDIDKMIEEVEK